LLHLFDGEGSHIRTEAKLGGFDIEGKEAACDKAWERLLAEFAPLRSKCFTPCDVWAKPFAVLRDGITYGLLYQVKQFEVGGPLFEWVMLEPRDIMFHPPWDSGQWST
jgi:hypothetical protein